MIIAPVVAVCTLDKFCAETFQVPPCVVFIFLERHTGTSGFFFMKPSTQYRQFAEECRGFAQSAKTEEQRKILLEMEAVWTKLAEEAEARAAKVRD
jgi:hypothetical protein